MIEENAVKILFEVDVVLRSLGIKYALWDGTCLGAVREKKFISYDADIDLATKYEDFLPISDELNRRLQDNGFETEWIDHRHKRPWDGGVFAIKAHKYGVSCDIMGLFKIKELRYSPGHIHDEMCVYSAKYLDNLTEIDFYGRKFLIPEDIDGYLTEEYGDWKVPTTSMAHRQFYPSKNGDDYWWVKLVGKIGYAYVVGDLLHRGHRLHLKNCKALCDYLIVGVLSEKAVLEKKPAAPIQSLSDRIEAVMDLKYVDCAVCQDTYNPLGNCKALRPDILFESSSHTEMPANDYMKSIGSQVIVMPYYSEESTTKIKERINETFKSNSSTADG